MSPFEDVPDFGDQNRNYIVFRVRCARCGRPLCMSTDPPKDRVPDDYDGNLPPEKYNADADAYVFPCEHCYGEALRPLRLLKSALAAAEGEKP